MGKNVHFQSRIYVYYIMDIFENLTQIYYVTQSHKLSPRKWILGMQGNLIRII